MFDNLKQPEDIFAETDKSAPQVAPPTAPQQPNTTQAPTSQTSELIQTSTTATTEPIITDVQSGTHGRIKTIIVFVAIVVVIGAAFLLSWKILRSKTPVTPKAPEIKTEETTNNIPQVIESPLPVETELPIEEIDSDSDGLSDARETELGTSIKSTDTDGDKLFDREEVEVYLTDPLNSDTDGDGYQDGNEVSAGYNPNGPGKLLEIPLGNLK